jgi:hypothetical protein
LFSNGFHTIVVYCYWLLPTPVGSDETSKPDIVANTVDLSSSSGLAQTKSNLGVFLGFFNEFTSVEFL